MTTVFGGRPNSKTQIPARKPAQAPIGPRHGPRGHAIGPTPPPAAGSSPAAGASKRQMCFANGMRNDRCKSCTMRRRPRRRFTCPGVDEQRREASAGSGRIACAWPPGGGARSLFESDTLTINCTSSPDARRQGRRLLERIEWHYTPRQSAFKPWTHDSTELKGHTHRWLALNEKLKAPHPLPSFASRQYNP